ncbi:transcription factor AP-1 [Sarotherodon galilaeus]
MVKGGKRHFSVSTDCKWFAHPGLSENETKTQENCTSTGIMLTQVKSSLPQALNFQRYPKWKSQQKSREYPFSDHDNKHALKDDVIVFSHSVGRRKCPDDRRQHISRFCLCHGGTDNSTKETRGNVTAYQSDFIVKEVVDSASRNRRFPHNHRQKSAEAALAQAGEPFMWFGRDDSDQSDTLQVLAATNCSTPSKP